MAPAEFIDIATPLDQSEISSSASEPSFEPNPSPSRRQIERSGETEPEAHKPDRLLIFTDTGRPVYDSANGEDATTLCSTLATIFHRLRGSDVPESHLTLSSFPVHVVFLDRRPLVFVAVTRRNAFLTQRILWRAHRVLVSLLTASYERMLSQRPNFDLRPLLAGAEKTLGRLDCAHPSEVNCVRVLALNQTVRRAVTSILGERLPAAVLFAGLVLVETGEHAASEAPDSARLVTAAGPVAVDPADLNALFTTLANNRSLASGENWVPFCFTELDRMGLAHVYVKRLELPASASVPAATPGASESESSGLATSGRAVVGEEAAGAGAGAGLFAVLVSSDAGGFHEISAHARRVEESLHSTGASELIMRSFRTPLALPGGVLDVKVALQGGQAFVASSVRRLGLASAVAEGYAAMQETLEGSALPRQFFRSVRLTEERVQAHQMIWRTSEFEMHLTLAGHVTTPGKAMEVYAYIKEQELKFFVPVRLPLKPWLPSGATKASEHNSFLKRLTGILI